jgi:hypothetical protein
MKTILKQKRNRFFATFGLAAALLYPVLTAEANEGASAESHGAIKSGEVLDTYRAAPEPTPMQSQGVIKCCSGNVDGHPDTCVWKPIGDECQGDKAPAWCPSEHSHPSNCRYL